MSRFSMILLAVLMLGGATVLAITAAVDFVKGHSGVAGGDGPRCDGERDRRLPSTISPSNYCGLTSYSAVGWTVMPPARRSAC